MEKQNWKEHAEAVSKFECAYTDETLERVKLIIELQHYVELLSTESNELLNVLKAWKYYGRPIDMANVREEIGDITWALDMLCNKLGWDQDEIRAENTQKLEIRFGDKFSSERANNRDLDKEKEFLNSKVD